MVKIIHQTDQAINKKEMNYKSPEKGWPFQFENHGNQTNETANPDNISNLRDRLTLCSFQPQGSHKTQTAKTNANQEIPN